jgi:general secretion pathway protein N
LIGAAAGKAGGIAIFLNETTKGIVRLKTGEGHAGWILSLVKGREATLQKGRATVILDISNPLGQ